MKFTPEVEEPTDDDTTIPQSVRICGRNYDIVVHEVDPFDAGKVGTFDAQRMRINILDGQEPIEEVDTVLHEILHALCWLLVLDLGDQEENVVARLATGLVAVLQDNPDLGAYLTAER